MALETYKQIAGVHIPRLCLNSGGGRPARPWYAFSHQTRSQQVCCSIVRGFPCEVIGLPLAHNALGGQSLLKGFELLRDFRAQSIGSFVAFARFHSLAPQWGYMSHLSSRAR